MRKILNRYIYSCDGYTSYRAHRGAGNRSCENFEVVDAIHEHDADAIVRQRGWRFEYGVWVCGGAHDRRWRESVQVAWQKSVAR